MNARIDFAFTDLCLELTCEQCRRQLSLDGYVSGALVQCPNCHARYELSRSIAVRRLPRNQRIRRRIVVLDDNRHTH